MKKRIISALICAGMLFGLVTMNAKADTTEPELIKGSATAYCLTGTTYSGQETRDGICAGNKDYYGKTLILYKRLPDDSIGEMIGIYECLDMGGSKGIKSGKVIDVWCENLDACQEYMDLLYEDGCKGKVYIQVIEDVVG